jgi:hypothetical protein
LADACKQIIGDKETNDNKDSKKIKKKNNPATEVTTAIK